MYAVEDEMAVLGAKVRRLRTRTPSPTSDDDYVPRAYPRPKSPAGDFDRLFRGLGFSDSETYRLTKRALEKL